MQQIQIPAALHQLWSKYRDLPPGIVLFKFERVFEDRADHEPVGRFENHQARGGQTGPARRFFHQIMPTSGKVTGLLIKFDMQCQYIGRDRDRESQSFLRDAAPTVDGDHNQRRGQVSDVQRRGTIDLPCHEIVVAQRQRVECLKAQGHDSEYAEDVLRRYEQSQAIFEDHLARLLEQRPI